MVIWLMPLFTSLSLSLSLSLRVIVLTVLKPPCRRDLIESEKSNLGNPAVPVPSLLTRPDASHVNEG